MNKAVLRSGAAMQWTSVLTAMLVLRPAQSTAVESPEPIPIGSRLELFVDEYLIESTEGVQRRLHSPERREVAIKFDRPWEGGACGYVTVFQDGDIYRMYYRGQDVVASSYSDYSKMEEGKFFGPEATCYAESRDGIHWTRPRLNLFRGEYISRYGTKFTLPGDNNVVWLGQGREVDTCHNFTVFKDTNPACKPEARYKAVGRVFEPEHGFLGYQSSDGVHWSLIREEALMSLTKMGRADSQSSIFWDALRNHYRDYHRGDFRFGFRDIVTMTSDDFHHWPDRAAYIDTGSAPREHLYTTNVLPYFRAPHIYLAFPMRLVTGRVWVEEHPEHEISDTVFMSSRDGVHFDRSFMEAWIRPGFDPDRKSWIHGNTLAAWGLLQTGRAELSLYWCETQGQIGSVAQMRRGTLRLDGFVSMHAGNRVGSFLTKPLIFEGSELVINFSTSAVGSIQVEIQDAPGTMIEGYDLTAGPEIYGDAIEQVVSWKGGSDVSSLAGKPIRLRFLLRDADLYSFRFR